jgi:hypothetical protein
MTSLVRELRRKVGVEWIDGMMMIRYQDNKSKGLLSMDDIVCNGWLGMTYEKWGDGSHIWGHNSKQFGWHDTFRNMARNDDNGITQ